MAKKPKCGSKSLRIIPAAFSTNYATRSRARWDGNPPRPPLKGELYLSGAEGFECAYEAPADMAGDYFIAAPIQAGAVGGQAGDEYLPMPKRAAKQLPLEDRLAAVASEARAAGYAITYWNPTEVGQGDVETLIDAVVQRGNDYLAEANGWPDPDDEQE